MKNIIINPIMSIISRELNYDEKRLAIIRYGLSSLYLQITKMFVIFSLSYFLGLFFPLLKLMVFYSLLRLTAFGVHAKKSLDCWIASLISFTLLPYLSVKLFISPILKVIITIICICLLIIYAPADTEKRPLIHKKKRILYKVISILTSLIYLYFIIKLKNNPLGNSIFFGLILSVFTVLPITYKLFNVSYNNYKNYKKGGI